ncbi:hypothetical protein CO731_01473 [Aminobacter sp. MSH1]|nr:hypothetical protein CO731_01473 [Aminobacter sp. MSH1]
MQFADLLASWERPDLETTMRICQPDAHLPNFPAPQPPQTLHPR